MYSQLIYVPTYTVMGNMDAFDQILSHITVLYPPEVVMPCIINDIAVKKKLLLSNIYIILGM